MIVGKRNVWKQMATDDPSGRFLSFFFLWGGRERKERLCMCSFPEIEQFPQSGRTICLPLESVLSRTVQYSSTVLDVEQGSALHALRGGCTADMNGQDGLR